MLKQLSMAVALACASCAVPSVHKGGEKGPLRLAYAEGHDADGLALITDRETGCQYVLAIFGTRGGAAVVPRLHRAADGKIEPVCEPTKEAKP